jgi:hypothetical protein
MTTQTGPVTEQPAPVKKRGRENALDMVRSLGLVLIVVLFVWWLAQPNDEDTQTIRVIDPGPSISEVSRQAPGTPVPTSVPPGWQPTVSDGDLDGLRLGYVTPNDQYAEYAVSLTSAPGFLETVTGKGVEVGTFQIDGVPWRQFAGKDDSTSLVRTVGPATVVVGGVRETTTLEDLRALARVVRP